MSKRVVGVRMVRGSGSEGGGWGRADQRVCKVAGRMLPVRWAWSSILGRWWGNEGGRVWVAGGWKIDDEGGGVIDCMVFWFFFFRIEGRRRL